MGYVGICERCNYVSYALTKKALGQLIILHNLKSHPNTSAPHRIYRTSRKKIDEIMKNKKNPLHWYIFNKTYSKNKIP